MGWTQSRFIVAGLLCCGPALAQRAQSHGSAGGGHPAPAHQAPPSHGPAPVARTQPAPARQVNPTRPATPSYYGRAQAPASRAERPRVETNERWVGHESGPEDRRYHLVHPFHAGRFEGPSGASYLYRIGGWDAGAHRFWFNGWAWGLAAWDWEYVDDWDWANDQVVIYDDPDHVGWYLAYNERLGTYVHVQYDGTQG